MTEIKKIIDEILEPVVVNNTWGTFTEVISIKDVITTFQPNLVVPKLGNPEFSAWVTLCYRMIGDFNGSLEVQTILLLNKQLGKWKLLIPKQNVTGGSVSADLTDCVDLITGEKYLNHKYPKGYRQIGTCHSHGKLKAFFSGIDDASELGFPGMHCTFGDFGNVDTFQIAASVVYKNQRYCIDASHLFDIKYDNTISYHKNVNDQIEETKYDTSIKFRYYEPYISEDQPLYVKYTDKYTKLVQQKREGLNQFDLLADDLSSELFNVLSEAENTGSISTQQTTDYIEEYDDKLNKLVRDTSICDSEKLVILQNFCNQIVNEVRLNIKRYEV